MDVVVASVAWTMKWHNGAVEDGVFEQAGFLVRISKTGDPRFRSGDLLSGSMAGH
jgi:hypothetical protein